MSRLKRKRIQEGRRRLEFKEAFESLTKTLLEFDKDFSLEHEQRERLTSTRLSSKKKNDASNDDDAKNSLFSRVELLNQAIFTIKRLHEEITEYRVNFADLESGRKTVKDVIQSSHKKRKVCYHHGVGPVVSDDKSETKDESQEPQESQLLADVMRQNVPNLSLGQLPLLGTSSSLASMQQAPQRQLLDQIQLQEYQRQLLESQLSMATRPTLPLSSALGQGLGQIRASPNDALHGQYSQDLLLRSALVERYLGVGMNHGGNAVTGQEKLDGNGSPRK